jgi:hypothetical protein
MMEYWNNGILGQTRRNGMKEEHRKNWNIGILE